MGNIIACGHIKENGEQCRRSAVWGLEPPRCAGHRLDGAAKGTVYGDVNMSLLSKYYYGGGERLRVYRRRDGPELRLAKLFGQFHFLGQGMKAAEEANDLKQLLRLTHLKTEVVIQIVAEIEEYGETLTEDALELAEVMVRVIQAERDEVERKLQAKRFGSLKRSPGYWAVYRFVKGYIETYHISPTYREIVKGTGLPGKGSAFKYVRQLERDGFVERVVGERRNIRLVG